MNLISKPVQNGSENTCSHNASRRNSKRKMSSASMQSAVSGGSGTGTDVQMEEQQVGVFCRESQERLILLHDELKETLDGFIKNSAADGSKTQEQLMITLKLLMGRAQLGIYDSQLLNELCHYLQNFERIIGKFRSESRRVLQDNTRLRHQIENIREEVFAKEADLASLNEDKKYWQFMCEMVKMETAHNAGEEDVVSDWYSCLVFPEELFGNLSDFENIGQLQEPYEKFQEHLKLFKFKDAIDQVYGLFAHSNFKDPKLQRVEALMYTNLIKKIFERDEYFDTMVDLGNKSLKIREILYGENSKSALAALNLLGMIYWKKDDHLNAAKQFFRGLKIMENIQKKDSFEIEAAKQYSRLGQLLFKGGFPEEGIKSMEASCILLELLLPQDKEIWYKTMVSLAAALNEIKSNEDALCITCEMIDYFHEEKYGPISERNPTIYDVALRGEQATAPVPHKLDNNERSICRELSMVYDSYFKFDASRFIDTWLQQCDKAVDATENQNTHEMVLGIMGGKRTPETANSPTVKKITKKPLKLPEHVKQLTVLKISNTSYLDYKNILKNSKGIPNAKTISKSIGERINKLFKSQNIETKMLQNKK